MTAHLIPSAETLTVEFKSDRSVLNDDDLMTALRENRRLSGIELGAHLQCSPAQTTKLLEPLAESGLIQAHGIGRGRQYTLRVRSKITSAFGSLELGALRRCESLVWLATRRVSRLALHPNPAAKCRSYFVTHPKPAGLQTIGTRLGLYATSRV